MLLGLIITFVLLTPNALYSQVSIEGRVLNTNGDPIEFASIQIFVDSTHYQSAITDSVGQYSINVNDKSSYELMARSLGYLPLRKAITSKNDTILNIVLQHDSIYLKEVLIVGQKSLIKASSNGYFINIKGNFITKGKETMDLLKQLPTIQITNESINILGKNAAIVYINDKIVRLEKQSLVSYLNSLPPEIIISIEIITTPTAQYDAEGNVGIIKINTDKNLLPGFKEFFRVGFINNSYLSYMASGYINYTGNKIDFECNFSNGDYSTLNQSSYTCLYPSQTTTTFNPKKWNFSSAEIQTTLGYRINKNSALAIDFQAPVFNKENINDIKNYTHYIDKMNSRTDSTIFSNGETNKDINTYNAELFFKHTFSNKKSFFTASCALLDNNTLNNRVFSSMTQIGNTNLTSEKYSTEGSVNYKILTSKLDFSFPVINCEVSTGFKFSFTKSISDNNFFIFINDIKTNIPSLSNQFEYTEGIQSLYLNIGKDIGKWSLKGGLRGELTSTDCESLTNNEVTKNSYINIFPSFSVSHSFPMGNVVALSYASRFERPPYQYLDPFRWYISKYDYVVGNPYLKPSYFNIFDISLLAGDSFSIKLYYTGQTNKIGQYVVLDSLNILNQIQRADNFMNELSYGINLYKFLKFKNRLETVIQGSLFYSEFRTKKIEFSNLYGFGSFIAVNNTYSLNENFQMLLNLEEQLPGLYNYRKMDNSFCLNFGFNYINQKNNFEIRLLMADVFKTSNPEYYYTSGGIKQVYNNYYDSRFLRLVFAWRPGNWFNNTPNISTPSNIDEKQRLQ